MLIQFCVFLRIGFFPDFLRVFTFRYVLCKSSWLNIFFLHIDSEASIFYARILKSQVPWVWLLRETLVKFHFGGPKPLLFIHHNWWAFLPCENKWNYKIVTVYFFIKLISPSSVGNFFRKINYPLVTNTAYNVCRILVRTCPLPRNYAQ